MVLIKREIARRRSSQKNSADPQFMWSKQEKRLQNGVDDGDNMEEEQYRGETIQKRRKVLERHEKRRRMREYESGYESKDKYNKRRAKEGGLRK